MYLKSWLGLKFKVYFILWLFCAVMANERERCKRAYDRLHSMVQGVGPNDTARIGACCSTWADPTGVQWKYVNKLVDKDMIKSIWRGVHNDNISKGRLKMSQCTDNDIRENDSRYSWMSWANPCIIRISPYGLPKCCTPIL